MALHFMHILFILLMNDDHNALFPAYDGVVSNLSFNSSVVVVIVVT